MEFLNNFMQNYGMEILSMIITAIAGYLGIVAKSLLEKHSQNKIVKQVAQMVVMATQQMWKDLEAEVKLDKALKSFSEVLAQKGIIISELEMRLQLEAAVGEFNKAFDKKRSTEQ